MGLITSAIGFGIAAAIVYFAVLHIFTRWKLRDVNQARSYPVVGHALITKTDSEGLISQVMGLVQMYDQEKRLVLLWLGPFPTLMICSAKFLEPIVSSTKHMNKGIAYALLEPWLGLSVLTSRAEKWRPKRKLLTPTFHYDILKDFVPIFNHQSRILVNKMKHSSDGNSIEILSLVTLCTLDIICETSMGRSVDAQTKTDGDYVWAVHTINNLVQDRIRNPLMWIDFLYNIFGKGREFRRCIDVLHSFTKKVINERRVQLEENDWKIAGRRAFLDLLLEAYHKNEIDLEDIQAEVDTFMFEGHDTTSTAVSWTLHLVGNYPDIQRKIQEELDVIMGDRDEVLCDDIAKMKYLECCIKEALRLYPSVPIIMRELGCDQEIGGTVFSKGTRVLVNSYSIHRDPSQWEDPEEFIPERFYPENSNGRHCFAYVPFSAGSRNCIGQRFAMMEEKVILAWILRHFTVTALEKRFEARPKIEIIIRPVNGLHLKLTKRRM